MAGLPLAESAAESFRDLDLMPATRKAYMVFLLKAIVLKELLSQIAPEDHGKIVRVCLT